MRTLICGWVVVAALTGLASGCGSGSGWTPKRVEDSVYTTWNDPPQEMPIQDDAKCMPDPQFDGDETHWSCTASQIQKPIYTGDETYDSILMTRGQAAANAHLESLRDLPPIVLRVLISGDHVRIEYP